MGSLRFSAFSRFFGNIDFLSGFSTEGNGSGHGSPPRDKLITQKTQSLLRNGIQEIRKAKGFLEIIRITSNNQSYS